MGDHQAGAAEEGQEGSTGLFKCGLGQRLAGNEKNVGTGREIRHEALHGGSQETFGTVTAHRLSDSLSGCHSYTEMRLVTGLENQDNKRVGIRLAKTPHPLEIS